EVRARVVLNATGPWVDAVSQLAGDASGPHLQPTKGVHLVLPERGFTAAFLLLHPADGRVFFVIPWMGKTLVGTTDTFDGQPDAVTVTSADMDYLQTGYNHHFEPGLQASDLLSHFVGLRPLIQARPCEPSSLWREFRLFTGPSGLLTVAGGKYTTYRHMAEVITDEVARRLGRRRVCRTRTCRLDGTPEVSWEKFVPAAVTQLSIRHGLGDAAARHLVNRYGRRAADVAAYLDNAPESAKPVVAGEPDLRVEFAYQRDHEMALRREDHLLRRTRLGLFRPELLADAALVV